MGPRRLVGAVLLSLSAGLSAQSSVPLPDQAHFFAEARKRLASNDLIQSRYSFRERTTELRLNPFGRNMGTGPVNVYEYYPHPNEALSYRRLVERGGRALTRAELRKQDDEYREKLADWQRHVAREGASARLARLREAEEAKRRDQALADEALSMFDFRITGRDTWEGEPAIIVAFAPRPGAQARSREGRLARVFAGRAWIHEFEYELMRVEATATDDVSFWGGVVGRLNKGLAAHFTRRRINGVWLPVETRFKGTGRALLVRKLDIDFARDYYDYRPFDFAELPARLGWEEAGGDGR
jgi:hypothetical protein